MTEVLCEENSNKEVHFQKIPDAINIDGLVCNNKTKNTFLNLTQEPVQKLLLANQIRIQLKLNASQVQV